MRLLRYVLVSLVALTLLSARIISQQGPERDPRLAPSKAGNGRISGTVTTSAGRPLPRAVVILASPDANKTWRTGTDGSGSFEFTGLVAGMYTVQASHPQYLTADYGQTFVGEPGSFIRLEEGQSVRAALIAVRGGAITGRVLDDFGHPLSDVAVTAYHVVFGDAGQHLVPVAARTYRSNDIGQYRISGLTPGDYYLMAEAWRAPAPIDRNIGQVFAPTWYPGTLSLDDARLVSVTADSEVSEVDLQLTLTMMTSITGTIAMVDGSKPAEVRLQLLPADSRLRLGTRFPTTVDRAGRFRIDRVVPGRYILVAQTDSGPHSQPESPKLGQERRSYYVQMPLEVTSEPIEELMLILTRASTISGRLQTDRPLPPEARLVIASSYIDGHLSGGSSSRINERGQFSLTSGPGRIRLLLSGLPSGWIVESIRSGGKEVAGTGLLLGAEDVGDVEVTLSSRSGSVSGTVSSDNGQPARHHTVVLISSDGSFRTNWAGGLRIARLDQRGAFAIGGLRPGTYFVVAVEYIAPARLYDPATWKSVERAGERVIVAKGEAKHVFLRPVTLPK